MFFRIMDKDRLPDLVSGLSTEFEVVGPVAKGEAFVFAPVTDPASLRLDYDTTILPAKKYFLPPKERLMRFTTGDMEVVDDTPEVTPRVLFGLHPCDINALTLTDNVYLDEREDPYYKARREATIIVGHSCDPREECFCNAWDTDEVHWGFDLFLTDLGDRYFVSARTVKGADVLNHYGETRPVTPADTADFQARTARFKASFQPALDTSQLPLLMDAKYADEIWEELGEKCLTCGACSMVCPTCFCFDVSDELDVDLAGGERVRTWDSCLYTDFALVAHGHNFRSSRAARVRNRFYHKQLGYLSKYERVLCVGCGRCERACKVGINPRVVIEALQKGGAE